MHVCSGTNLKTDVIFSKQEESDLKKIGSIAAFLSLFGAGSAVAVPVNAVVELDGFAYDLSLTSGNYETNSALLESQVWFGDSELSGDLALAVGTQLGFGFGTQPIYGPAFAYSVVSGGTIAIGSALNSNQTSVFNYLELVDRTTPSGTSFVFANSVTALPVPLPASALLLGAGFAGLGMVARRRRKPA
jgi:hypothetical protein